MTYKFDALAEKTEYVICGDAHLSVELYGMRGSFLHAPCRAMMTNLRAD